MDSDDHIDIRRLIREHGARQLTIARLNAPENWQGELRTALAAHREPATIFSNNDFRLFLQSFAIFFTATMMFLI
ncbi:hypothetical protein [Sphingopyxis sp. H115]|uniref:hypothetical protein n=1 Tax=Sphingopyxis sp. H115 TaxID=1759073 RepID=UPI00073774A1|nr:hypothetical protein [Sphingopyxis sp. H115]KTE14265.1 hypothetical protein ATE71_08275 [Sphingopyxis sp. H115]